MAKPSKDAAIVALAESMLNELRNLKPQGGDAYPPRLRDLAARVDPSADGDQIQKAAAKTLFSRVATVTEKVGRTPSLDSPVYFKEDVPKKTATSVAGDFIQTLESQRGLGPGSYPLTLQRLAELCRLKTSDAVVAGAVRNKAFTERAVLLGLKLKGRARPNLSTLVVLQRDAETHLPTVFLSLLKGALAVTSTGGKKPAESTAYALTDLKGKVDGPLGQPFLNALEHALVRNHLPEGIAWVINKGKIYLFLAENLRTGARAPVASPGPPTPPVPPVESLPAPMIAEPSREFASEFRAAFDMLDRHNGATNFVKLRDLRERLAWAGREDFDAGLRALRLAGEFALDSHEGLHGELSAADRDAGVQEAGSLLVYVSRRSF